MSTCCLCSNLARLDPDEFWNKPLFESSNFVVIPSLGSLVEGWLLVLPKRHFISMGALPIGLASELEQVKNELTAVMGSLYGELCAFEHGPALPGLSVGCGVDHAHLHIVPINFDLASAAEPFMPPGVVWSPAIRESCRAAFEDEGDYLYLEQPLGNGRIATHSGFGSQIFRKAIASRLGIPERFSWRDYPQKETVAKTVRSLSNAREISA
jgi:ATP adenylyltransferase